MFAVSLSSAFYDTLRGAWQLLLTDWDLWQIVWWPYVG